MLKHDTDFKHIAHNIVYTLDTKDLRNYDVLKRLIQSHLYTSWLEGYNEGFKDSAFYTKCRE